MNIITPNPIYLPAILIINGKIITHNLKDLNLNKEWLKDQLSLKGLNSPKDVFYTEIKGNGTIYVDEKSGW